jgi:hypothetical protein
MSNVLITGDVHLHDYRNHNLFDDPRFRLNQFDKLAQRLVNLAIGSKAEALIIAGDFLHVANPRPYIVNAAFEFLDTLTTQMDVYLTHGQHDYDSRTSMEGQHTLLTLCNRIPKVYYVHKDSREIAGRTFYFLGWEPNWSKMVREIPSCDVLIGHAQPGEVKVGQRGLYMYGGESVPSDWNIFSLAFLGDIHYHQNRDNWVIPGTPIQHSFNDDPNVGVVLLDTELLTWKRLPTIVLKHWEFLQFIVTDDVIKDKFVVTRPKTTTITAKFQEKLERSLDTMAVIQGAIEEAELEELHTELLGSVSKDVRAEVNLNFAIERIKIQNFRSIADFEWENVNEGVKLVSGRNGTGKSSLVSALMFALTGDGSARNLTQNGKKNMFVEVTFLYGQLRHTIRRGWSTTSGKLQYFINDEEIPAENQRALTQKINENLPFLGFSDLFYHEQDRPGFLASYNYTSRVDLVSRVLGLKIVNELQQAALNKTVLVDQKLTSLREKLASATSVADQESLVDFSIMETIDDGNEENLQQLKKATKTLLDQEATRYISSVQREASLAGGIKRATTTIAQIEAKRQAVNEQTCYTCGQRISGKELGKVSEEIDSELRRTEEELSFNSEELNQLRITIKESQETSAKIESKYESLTSKLSDLVLARKQVESLRSLKDSIDKAKKTCILINDEIDGVMEVKEQLDAYRKLMSANGVIMRSLLSSVSELLTSDTIRVRAYRELVNGELRPDFGVDMSIPGQGWIAYDELSGGQKTVSDLTILEKLVRLVGGVGLLVFDETFKYLDNENLELVVELIKSMQCHSTFIISHAEGFPYWDLAVQTKVDNTGYTSYTLR